MPSKPGNHANSIRIGEQDSWAYLAYPNGKDVLREMFVVNGDSAKVKEDIIRKIEMEGSADYTDSEYGSLLLSGSKNAFQIYSTVAGLDIK